MERRKVEYEEVGLNDEEICEAIEDYMIYRHQERAHDITLEWGSSELTAKFKVEPAPNARRPKRSQPASGAPEKTVELPPEQKSGVEEIELASDKLCQSKSASGELKVENTETDPAELLQRVRDIEARLGEHDMKNNCGVFLKKFGATDAEYLIFDQLTSYLAYLDLTFCDKLNPAENPFDDLLAKVRDIEARLNDDQMIRCGRERRQRFGEQSMGSYDLDYDQLKIHHDYLVETFPG